MKHLKSINESYRDECVLRDPVINDLKELCLELLDEGNILTIYLKVPAGLYFLTDCLIIYSHDHEEVKWFTKSEEYGIGSHSGFKNEDKYYDYKYLWKITKNNFVKYYYDDRIREIVERMEYMHPGKCEYNK